MDVQTPSPQTTLAILLGASEWPDSPDFPGSKAFAHAISRFRSYLFDPRRFGLPKENALDLFDVDDSPHIIDRKISQFLEHRISEMKQAGNVAKDLLLYFVGHGGFVGRDSDYYLALRCTSTEKADLSGFPMESLASTLTDKARYLRRVIILDCCYAAAAFTSFQAEGPAQLGIDQTFSAFEEKAKTVGKGTALLCSSGKTVASQIAQDQSCTMFSKALLQVLCTGDKHRQEQHYFSLREVADLTEEVITRELEGKAPRPEVHSPDQKEGDVANIPFFPNLAAKEELPLGTILDTPTKQSESDAKTAKRAATIAAANKQDFSGWLEAIQGLEDTMGQPQAPAQGPGGTPSPQQSSEMHPAWNQQSSEMHPAWGQPQAPARRNPWGAPVRDFSRFPTQMTCPHCNSQIAIGPICKVCGKPIQLS